MGEDSAAFQDGSVCQKMENMGRCVGGGVGDKRRKRETVRENEGER